jgi:molecular chaperone GrpE
MPDTTRKRFEEFAEDDVREPLDPSAREAPDAPPAADAQEPEPTEAERQRDQYYDLLLRTRAEFDNYRKRIDRERQEMADAAASDLLRELLPLIDNMERALAADIGEGVESLHRGVELIHRQMLDLLRKRGIRPIAAVGADFDPHIHQAVVHEEVPGRREGEVVEELRRGYMLGDKLLRPALVKVAKS